MGRKVDVTIPYIPGSETKKQAEALRKRREKQDKELQKIMQEMNPGAYKKKKNGK